jgi:antitoxin ParD1/3/4
MATMDISLPDPMKDWVEEEVKGGTYTNVSDYIRDLIGHDQTSRAALEAAIAEGLRSGRSSRKAEDVMASAKARLKRGWAICVNRNAWECKNAIHDSRYSTSGRWHGTTKSYQQETAMTAVKKLSIALTPEFAADIRKAIATGEYASTSEVIRDAMRTWKQVRQSRAVAVGELRRLWQEGLDSGESAPLDAKDIKRRGRARLAALRNAQR